MSTTLFRQADLAAMPSRHRAHFVNSLSGFKSANLLATKSTAGVTNLAMISSVVHLGADPALMGYITRPKTVARDSIDNIETTGVYTFNHVHSLMLPAAHQAAAKFASDQSEFSECGFNEGYVDDFFAPYVQESALSIGLALVETVPIRHNGTQLVIGKIEWVKVPQTVINDDGYIAIEKLDSIAVSGLDGYHQSQRIARFSYPEIGCAPKQLHSL
ncbi:flavin reductase [Aliidiomarina indica]|uniref:flavin reductase n=1 Tax=Aliidiomarina indica TaxID=2749147 RepID=UPI0018908ABF|nr:flavin reductase [Aliidiomarina indica]